MISCSSDYKKEVPAISTVHLSLPLPLADKARMDSLTLDLLELICLRVPVSHLRNLPSVSRHFSSQLKNLHSSQHFWYTSTRRLVKTEIEVDPSLCWRTVRRAYRAFLRTEFYEDRITWKYNEVDKALSLALQREEELTERAMVINYAYRKGLLLSIRTCLSLGIGCKVMHLRLAADHGHTGAVQYVLEERPELMNSSRFADVLLVSVSNHRVLRLLLTRSRGIPRLTLEGLLREACRWDNLRSIKCLLGDSRIEGVSDFSDCLSVCTTDRRAHIETIQLLLQDGRAVISEECLDNCTQNRDWEALDLLLSDGRISEQTTQKYAHRSSLWYRMCSCIAYYDKPEDSSSSSEEDSWDVDDPSSLALNWF